MRPIGWLAFYWDGSGVVTYSSKTTSGPSALPATACLGTRVFYAETTRIDDGPEIHYSDVFKGADFVVFVADERGGWRCRNAASRPDTDPSLVKEGLELVDELWESIRLPVFFNDDDNRVGRW